MPQFLALIWEKQHTWFPAAVAHLIKGSTLSGYLSYYRLPLSSKQSAHSPLTSDINKGVFSAAHGIVCPFSDPRFPLKSLQSSIFLIPMLTLNFSRINALIFCLVIGWLNVWFRKQLNRGPNKVNSKHRRQNRVYMASRMLRGSPAS